MKTKKNLCGNEKDLLTFISYIKRLKDQSEKAEQLIKNNQLKLAENEVKEINKYSLVVYKTLYTYNEMFN